MSGIVGKNLGRGSGLVKVGSVGADSVTGASIADDAIDSEHYTNASIDNAHLADNAVDTQEIADNAITLAKMAGGTDGNLISFDTSGNPVAVATGNDGQVLTSSGSGAVCAFEDAAGGLSVHAGSFSRDKATASGDSSVTGVGFTPKAGMFWALQNSTNFLSIGFQGDAGTTQANCLSDYRFAVTDANWSYSGSNAVFRNDHSGSHYYWGYISAWDSDGFTVTWARTGTPTGTMSIGYLVIG